MEWSETEKLTYPQGPRSHLSPCLFIWLLIQRFLLSHRSSSLSLGLVVYELASCSPTYGGEAFAGLTKYSTAASCKVTTKSAFLASAVDIIMHVKSVLGATWLPASMASNHMMI